ncbi:MAG TPA: cytochrome c, partial [Bacteroidia bacterium]|nr:cytochrome c [Bacteroidia bacterium]
PMDTATPCGINPASIKVLKDKKFANTFIATREFETRMRYIHRACKQQVLEIYIKNIDKNLWEADKLVYELLQAQGNAVAKQFKTFYEEKLGNVEGLDGAKLLSEYYNRQLKKVEEELEAMKKLEIKSLKKESEKFKAVKQQYRDVLWKREKYRMEKYRFQWSDMGWMNIDTGWIPKNCDKRSRMVVTLYDTQKYDRSYVYVLMTGIKSLNRLNTTNNREFYGGNEDEKTLLVECNEAITLLAIAYKGKQAYYLKYSFIAGRDNNIELKDNLTPVSANELKKILRAENKGHLTENKIADDLVFQEKFYKEKLRQGNLKREQEFIVKLHNVAFKCCVEPAGLNGKSLFEENCTACHAVCDRAIAPALHGVQKRPGRTEAWLFKFIKNSQQMISEGDPLAVQLYEENNRQVMNSFEFLNNEEIKAILDYVGDAKCGTE